MERFKTILIGTAVVVACLILPFLLLVAVNIGLTMLATSPLAGALFFTALIGLIAGSLLFAYRPSKVAAK